MYVASPLQGPMPNLLLILFNSRGAHCTAIATTMHHQDEILLHYDDECTFAPCLGAMIMMYWKQTAAAAAAVEARLEYTWGQELPVDDHTA